MLTGRHIVSSWILTENFSDDILRKIKVRDVYCKGCETKLGWMYEFATHEEQVYSLIHGTYTRYWSWF